MYGSGEGMLLPVSLVGGWFGGGWGVPGLLDGRGVTLLV
jgi:hypothetical protein